MIQAYTPWVTAHRGTTHEGHLMKVNVHLTFAGDCRAAFEFYAATLGGQIVAIMPYKGSPVEQMAPGGDTDQIMHAFLNLENIGLMGADTSAERFTPMGGAHVSLNYDNFDKGKAIFDALANGGEVQMPFEKTFWTPGFGTLRDRFGTQWMINVEA
jgi:PhnB protein